MVEQERAEQERAGRRADTASDVVWAYLGKQADVIARYADDVRSDGPDAVHKSRVAARRSRSILKVYGDVVDSDEAPTLSAELKWFGEKLGAPRDAEVLRDYLIERLDDLDSAEVQGPVGDRLPAELSERHARAHATLVEALDTDRYRRLRALLDDLVARRPSSQLGERPAGEVLPGLLERAVRRAGNLRDRAARDAEHLEGWHDVRKAAKAVRYCAEALVDAFGQPAADVAARWEAVTEGLGAVQDSVVVADVLAERAWAAELAGEPVHTYTLLAERELARRRDALERGIAAVDQALERGANVAEVAGAGPDAAGPA